MPPAVDKRPPQVHWDPNDENESAYNLCRLRNVSEREALFKKLFPESASIVATTATKVDFLLLNHSFKFGLRHVSEWFYRHIWTVSETLRIGKDLGYFLLAIDFLT